MQIIKSSLNFLTDTIAFDIFHCDMNNIYVAIHHHTNLIQV